MPHHHYIQHPHVFKCELILQQLAQPFILVQHHIAGAGLQIAAKDSHEGGLAATICTDQPIAVAVAEFNGDIFKQGLRPELEGDVGGGKHEMAGFRKIWSAILPLHEPLPALIWRNQYGRNKYACFTARGGVGAT